LIKQRLSEKKPLVFGAFVDDSFSYWSGSDVMTANDIFDGSESGGHAMTIVGYDDTKNAFRIVNSWANTWGDNGFAWISYDLMKNPDFCFAVFVPY
jgi:C1A family cysteine protease